MRIQFGEWAPDAAGVESPILAEARNVFLSGGSSYSPMNSLADFGTDSLPSRCVGMFAARSAAGGWVVFAGTTAKLYRLVSSTWTDYTRESGGDYSVPAEEYWSFAQFGSLVIACNRNDDVQVLDVDSGATAFSALAGSPPKARYAAVVGDFLVLGALSSDGRAIRNSAFNNATGWTVGTDLCSEQSFPDGGRVTGLAGGEFGYVAQETAIRRMILQPGQDIAFRFERLEHQHGCASGYSLAATANGIFFLSDDGFYWYNPTTGLVPIGAEKVNLWFRRNSDQSRFFSVISFVDPYRPQVAWAFYNSSTSETFDRILFYNWKLNQFTYSTQAAQFWVHFAAPGTTLESLDDYGDIDGGLIPYPFDSTVWEGGRPVIAAININGSLGFLEGSTLLTALIRTTPRYLIPNINRSKVTDVEPLGIFNDATIGMRVGKREKTSSATSWTSSVSPSSLSGICRVIAAGRLHEFEMTLSQDTGTAWAFAQGLDVRAVPDGRK